MIDGDGHISKYVAKVKKTGKTGCRIAHKNRYELGLCGSQMSCAKFLEFLKTIIITDTGVRKTKSIWRVAVGGKMAREVMKILYPEKCTALDRKKEIVKNCLADVILSRKEIGMMGYEKTKHLLQEYNDKKKYKGKENAN